MRKDYNNLFVATCLGHATCIDGECTRRKQITGDTARWAHRLAAMRAGVAGIRHVRVFAMRGSYTSARRREERAGGKETAGQACRAGSLRMYGAH